MNYNVSIIQKSGHLHAVITGEMSKENVAGYLQDVLRECIARNCFRLLIEQRLEGPRLGAMDVFDVVSEGARSARGKMKEIAYVDVYAKDDLMQFAEHVAVNRGVFGRVFKTVAAAEAWLIESDPNQTSSTAAQPRATTRTSTTDKRR